MAFTKEQIKQAKQGRHDVVFQPRSYEVACWVVKVRGDFVWVLVKTGETIRLNATASRLLIQGKCRPRTEEAALDLLADALAAPCRGCNGKCVDNDCFNPNKREVYPEDWELR